MSRIWIRGTSGSGKTTLALAVARRVGIEAVDVDDLNWLPGWQERPREEFLALVEEVVARSEWVLAGNYTKILPLVEPVAETVVWLDYSLAVTFGRVLRRTIRRSVRGDLCCNGNRESFRNSFLSRDSILLWCLTTHGKRRRECAAFMAAPRPPGQVRLRHRTPGETRAWLASL